MKTYKLSILIVLFTFLGQGTYAQSWKWANQYGMNESEGASDITIDNNGNLYVIGHYSDTIVFGTDTLFAGGQFGESSYIIKLDSSGNLLWTYNFTGHIKGAFMATDDFGNLYLTGNLLDVIDFSVATLDPNDGELFLAQMDATGNFVWAKNFGDVNWIGSNLVQSNGIGLDQDGNIFITGNFKDTAIFATATLVKEDGVLFIAKFRNDGSEIWVRQAGKAGLFGNRGRSYAISVDLTGISYITGFFPDSATFGANKLTSYGGFDIFIAKYDSSGTCLWARNAGGSTTAILQPDYGLDLSVDNYGGVYVTGYYYDTATFGGIKIYSNGTANQNYFLAKYNSSGDCEWVRQRTGYDWLNTGSQVITDDCGNVYVAGSFKSDADFGNCSITSAVSTGWGSDLFVVKYDSSGTCIWATNADASKAPGHLALSSDNKLYVAGTFERIGGFGGLNYVPPDVFWADIFVGKIVNPSGGSCLTGLEKIKYSNAPEVNIYPNPFTTTSTLYSSERLRDASLSIYNILGEQVKLKSNINANEITIDRIGLGNNMYFFELRDNTGIVKTGKLLVY